MVKPALSSTTTPTPTADMTKTNTALKGPARTRGLTTPHFSSLLLTPPHSSSLLVTSPHSSLQLATLAASVHCVVWVRSPL